MVSNLAVNHMFEEENEDIYISEEHSEITIRVGLCFHGGHGSAINKRIQHSKCLKVGECPVVRINPTTTSSGCMQKSILLKESVSHFSLIIFQIDF